MASPHDMEKSDAEDSSGALDATDALIKHAFEGFFTVTRGSEGEFIVSPTDTPTEPPQEVTQP